MLIEKVRQRTFLYDTKSPNYRDQHMRAIAWEGIGKELKIKRKFNVSSRNVRIVCLRLNACTRAKQSLNIESSVISRNVRNYTITYPSRSESSMTREFRAKRLPRIKWTGCCKCSRTLLGKLTVPQLIKKFPTFYVTRRFITAFTTACRLSLT